MIEHVVMDYDGEPVTIENGEIYDAESSYYDHEKGRTVTQIWNPATLDWEDPDDDDEPCGNDRALYRLGWYDCNTDWRNW